MKSTKMDELPMTAEGCLVSEVETSMEQDGEEKILTKVCSNAQMSSARRSLYDLSITNFEDLKHDSLNLKDYENHLHQEMKDWKSVLHNAYKDMKQSKQKHPVVDKSILPPEKLDYLEKAECMQKFIIESIEFRQEAALFLEYEYEELMEMMENLETLAEQKLNLLRSNKIAENLAEPI